MNGKRQHHPTTRSTGVITRLLVQVLIVAFVCPPSLLASSFKEGYDLYSKGHMAAAESALSAAAKTTKNPAELGKVYKFLGITQYMQKKIPSARTSFQRALSVAPATEISANEVLDESVLPFFKGIKRTSAANKASPSKARSTPKNAPVSPAPAKGGVSIGKKTPSKTTRLKISSNVASATILIDGIIAGKAESMLEVQPGVVEVQLSAPGYLSKKARIQIVAFQENNVTINLEKPAPKPTPPPVAVASVPKAKTNKEPRPQSTNKGKKTNDFLPDPGADSLFSEPESSEDDAATSGRNLQQEFALDAGTGGASAAQPVAPAAPFPQQPMYPQQQQPMYQQPYTQPQMYAQPPPMYAYPSQPYAPMYQQPYPAPYGASPYGGGYPPAASPYAPAPPPVIAIPQDPLPVPASDPLAGSGSSETFLPPVETKSKPKPARLPYAGSSSRKKTTKKAAPTSNNMLIALLPFGAGQFQNGNTVLGLLFAGAEIGAAYWWYTNKQDADSAVAAVEAYNQSDASDQQKQKFSDDSEVYVTQKRQQQYYGMYGFFGLWAVGAGEAILNAPKAKKTKAKRRKLVEVLPDGADDGPQYALQIDDDGIEDDDALSKHSRQASYLPRVSFGLHAPELTEKNHMPEARSIGPAIRADWSF